MSMTYSLVLRGQYIGRKGMGRPYGKSRPSVVSTIKLCPAEENGRAYVLISAIALS